LVPQAPQVLVAAGEEERLEQLDLQVQQDQQAQELKAPQVLQAQQARVLQAPQELKGQPVSPVPQVLQVLVAAEAELAIYRYSVLAAHLLYLLESLLLR
jgi:hypothetical protein